ncbi:MAG: FAD-dependent oxidoreductase [Terricaulis sp.]
MKSVIIVGAGAIGLMCAVRLAKAGARVTVLEEQREEITVYGATASASAAGMLAPIEAEPSEHEQLALASFDLWKQWREGAAWNDAVRFDGAAIIAKDAAGVEAFVKNGARLGRAVAAMSVNKFRAKTDLSSKIENSVFIEDEATIDPLRMLSGLLMEARAHGVIVTHKRDVNNVTPTSVSTFENETFEADLVLLTPGAWATEQMKEVAPALKHIRAGKGQLVSVALGRDLKPNLRAPGFYIAQRREDVVLGATLQMDVTNRFADAKASEGLMAAAEALLPGEVHTRGEAWAGIRPMSPDGWPLIGRSGDFLIAAGHSRNGWLLAPITAEIITAYVMDMPIPSAWAALSPDRFGNS